MSAPANRWKLGLFVLTVAGVGIVGSSWLGLHKLERASHPAWAYFDEALTGLEEGSPVKFRGVTIGTVRHIRVGPDKKHLAVQAALYDDYLTGLGFEPRELDEASPLPANLRAMVVMSWVTNTSFVQVDFFPDPLSGPQQVPFETPPNTIRTVPSTAKSLEDASRELFRELPQMAAAAKELVQMLRAEVQAARLPEVMRRTETLLGTLDRKLREFDPQATLRNADATLADLRLLVADLRTELRGAELGATSAAVARSADAFGAAAGQIADQTAALPATFAGPLEQLRATLAAVERLAALLERDPGALLRGRGAAATSPLEERR